MIVHVFNSTIVSGPEMLVLPALPSLGQPVAVVFLTEARRAAESKRPVEYARGLGLDARTVEVKSRVDRQAVRDFAEVLEELGTTVVHAHDVKASAYLLKAAQHARRSGRGKYRIMSTHHGVRGRSGFRSKLYERIYSHLVLPKYDRILTVCSSDREILIRRGLPAEKITVHRNGVDRPAVDSDNRQQECERIRGLWRLQEKGVPANATVIGFLGRIAPEKRLDRILKICKFVNESAEALPDWRLVIFGTGPLEAELKSMTTEYGLDGRIVWMGYRSGVGAELAGFDLLISMSDAEGLPINLVEAGWGGTPVFATAVDGNLDLIPNPAHGTLVNVEESEDRIAKKLSKLLQDEITRKNMGLAFQKRVMEEFSGRKWLDQLRLIYQS